MAVQKSRWVPVLHVLLRGLAVLVVLVVGAAVVSADVRFVMRAAYEEARILVRRRPLDRLVEDERIPVERRAQFRLVLEARAYAADSLGLNAKDTYTSFSDVGRDTLLLLLTASRRTALLPYTWWYPVVGTVPYKGFFDLEQGREAAADLEARGYDVYLRPSAAFSTLGWFNDPLLSTALRSDPTLLVELVVHEIAHNTLYVPSATPFNESFAMFVGYRGAEAFFSSRGDTQQAERAARIWRDQLRLAAFYSALTLELEDLYASGAEEGAMLSRRDSAFAAARERLRGPVAEDLEAFDGKQLAERPLNNASVLAARIYMSDLEVFDRVLARFNGDLPVAVAAMTGAVAGREGLDPFSVVRGLGDRGEG